jgi:NADPH-dependent 2,4-dienoyl-CoA reductase/sulfur reductase-like enzyme
MSCASQARRRRGPEDLSIVVFESTEWISYSACGEPYFVSGEVAEVTSLLARAPEQFDQMDIDVRLHHLVTNIDIGSKTVTVDTPDGQLIELYGQLMYAIGAAPVAPTVPGVDLEGVFELHTGSSGGCRVRWDGGG